MHIFSLLIAVWGSDIPLDSWIPSTAGIAITIIYCDVKWSPTMRNFGLLNGSIDNCSIQIVSSVKCDMILEVADFTAEIN